MKIRAPQITRTLAAIALATPLAGCLPDKHCSTYEEIAIDHANTTIEPLFRACKDQDDCEPLCKQLYADLIGSTPDAIPPITDCKLAPDGNGGDLADLVVATACAGGRRPAGWRARVRRGCPEIGAYLATQAELEAASVRAFADTHADLVALGAPRALRAAAIAAAADEIRHARTCAALARRHGGRPRIAVVAPAARRDRRALALDNAVEGCVRETFGAVVAGVQARAAADGAVRRAMRTIARDEAAHAALSWRLHAWLMPQLDGDARAAIRAAMRATRAELASAPSAPPAVRAAVGMPDGAATRHVLAALDAAVWTAA